TAGDVLQVAIAEHRGRGPQCRRGAGETADVEVNGDWPLPDRLFEQRKPVVRVLLRGGVAAPGPALEGAGFVERRDLLQRSFAAEHAQRFVDVPPVARRVPGRIAQGSHDVTTAARVSAASPIAAAPIDSQLRFARRVGTTGSGGRLYFSGRSQRRKNAFSPPVPGWSSASAPYRYASVMPARCSSVTRSRAFTRSSTRSPYWIDPV